MGKLNHSSISMKKQSLINSDLKVKEKLDNFIDCIPNAITRCKNDEFFTIEFANQEFLDLIGYTSEEIKSLFNNRYTDIIHEDDRYKIGDLIEKQLETQDTFEVEYRVIHKNGSIIWVRDKGNKLVARDGLEYFYCSFIDITKVKLVSKQFRINENYYRIIMEKTGDSIFVINVDSNSITFSNNLIESFGEEVLSYKNLKDILDSDFIHQDDKGLYNNLISNVIYEEEYKEFEIRFKNKHEKYIWCLVKAYTITNEYNQPIKIIGIITDIDEAKVERANLNIMAKRDLLTGLYNKITSQSMIEEYIHNEGKNNTHALFIIDIDNFKGINDNLGHLFGDSVLMEVASDIKKMFRESDIVGRIGGDEFVVLMKNIVSSNIITEKAIQLRDALKRSYKGKKDNHEISGSIGIAFYPTDGNSFNDIFEKADIAAYYSKEQGKDCYHVYTSNMNEVQYKGSKREGFSKIDSENKSENEFSKYIFDILYKIEDIDLAINRILHLTARYYNISHIFIYEDVENNNTWKKTYEYCGKGIKPASNWSVVYDKLQHDRYKDLYDQNGVFYCSNIENLPKDIYNIYKNFKEHSILQSSIVENGVLKGYIAFSESSKNRMWTKKEIDASIFISRIISLFLLKMRKEKQLTKLNSVLNEVLEDTVSLNYIIDKESFEIIYINNKSKAIYSDVKVGDICYKALRDFEDICLDCPVRELSKENRKVRKEIYNSKYNMYIDKVASSIKLIDDREVYLISGYDITKYKANK